MDYAIARLAKLKKANLAGSASHTARTRPTPNADPTKQNIRFIGSTDPNEKLEDLVIAKIEQHKQKRKIRTDGVYCVELLLTASPSYFRPDDPTNGGYYEENRLKEWFQATQKWLKVQYGDRIVRAELHLDEITPHIHAYFVPLDDKGQLRCNHFFDGPKKMREFQDCYSAAVKHLGLERGIKGSVAEHQDIKDFYTIVESGRDLESGKLSPLQLQAKAADRDRAVKKKSEMEQTALRLAKENEALRTENFQLRSSLRKQADQLRDLPLEDVAWQLGLTKTKSDGKWKGLEHIINIDETKFHDFKPGSQKGGGGAIDLVMHVNNSNFNSALVWLRDRFGESGMLSSATHHARSQVNTIVSLEPAPQFQPPVANESQWSAVELYLTQKRGLPLDLVQDLHKSGLVYADREQNAVFRMRDLKGETVGAFQRGTRGDSNTFMGYASGTKRTEGWFYIESGQRAEKVQRVVLCKSPIDALSLAKIETQEAPRERTMYLAADSALSLPVEYLKTIPLVVAAYDNDASGNQIAKEIQELLPQATRAQPNALDWNLELLEQLRLEESKRERSEEKRLQEEDKRFQQQEYANAIALSVRLLWQRQITKGEFYNLSLEENVIKLKRVEGEEIAQIPNDGSQPLGIALNKQDVDRFRSLQKRLTTGGAGGDSTVEEPSSVEPQPVPRKVDLEL